MVIYYEKYHAILDNIGVCYLLTNWTDPRLLDPKDILKAINIVSSSKFKNILDLVEKIHIAGKLFNYDKY